MPIVDRICQFDFERQGLTLAPIREPTPIVIVNLDNPTIDVKA
jgi:hypothetical protein